MEHPSRLGGQLGVQRPRIGRRFMDMGVEDIAIGFACEGGPPGEHVIDHHAQAVHIAATIHRPPHGLFGGHVFGRAQHRGFLFGRAQPHRAGNAEIG